MTSFRELRVWQHGMDVVELIYRLSESFPRQEAYGLTGQLRRAAVSIPSNIAEGASKQHTKEFLQHISIAQGSLAELETQLEIAVRLKYLSAEQVTTPLDLVTSLKKQLFALRNALRKKL